MVQTPQNAHKMILIEAHQSLAPLDLNREISAIMRAGPGIVALKNNQSMQSKPGFSLIGNEENTEVPELNLISSPIFNGENSKKSMQFAEDDKVMLGSIAGYFDPDDEDEVEMLSGREPVI